MKKAKRRKESDYDKILIKFLDSKEREIRYSATINLIINRMRRQGLNQKQIIKKWGSVVGFGKREFRF